MQAIDLSSIVPLFYVAMMLLLWLFPPRWVKKLGEDAVKMIDDLKTWAPRLMGALRGNKHEEFVQEAQSDKGIVGLLTTIAPILQYLPQLLELAEQFGIMQGQPQNQSQGGVGW